MENKNFDFNFSTDTKYREGEMGHVFFKIGTDESEEQFPKNMNLAAHTEYTAHKNGRAQGPAVTIDISKTLFDKEEPVENNEAEEETEESTVSNGLVDPE